MSSDEIKGTKIGVLDKGFIQLVDCMGGDLTTTNSARVSFGKRKNKISAADEKLIKYLSEHKHYSPFRHTMFQFHVKCPETVARQWYKHCYSDDTEVYTDSGWKLWSNVISTDKLANVCENGTFYFRAPKELISYDYEGDMVYFSGNRVNLLITDKHRMYVEKRRDREFNGKFEFVEARSCLSKEFRLPLLPKFQMPDGEESDYYRGLLYGFSLAEGNFSASKNRIYFILKKDREIGIIKDLMRYFDQLKWVEHNTRTGFLKFSCNKPSPLFFGTCSEKFVDFSYLQDTHMSYKGLLDGMFFGDGTITNSGTKRISSVSEHLIKALEKVCLFLGIPTHIQTTSREYFKSANRFGSNYDYITINIKTRKQPNLHRNSQGIIPYKGKVYCATVDTGLLLVRREGIVSVCGNCVGADYAFKDTAWNEVSSRYVVMDEEFYVPDKFRKQSTDNKQASTDEEVEQADKAREEYEKAIKLAYESYKALLSLGVAKEIARGLLPVSFYTEFYWTASLQAVYNFIFLRDSSHAQWEIREFAIAMKRLVELVAPISIDALLKTS